MSMSVVFAQRRYFAHLNTVDWETHCAPYRIPLIIGFTSTQTMPGGWDSAQFTIPKKYARFDPHAFPDDTMVFCFEGLAMIFYGPLVDITPQDTGDYQVTVDGAWRLLSRTFMREVWSDNDLTKLTQSPGSAKSATFSTTSQGNLEIGFPKAAQPTSGKNLMAQGDYIALDYYLFNELADLRDGKVMDGWEITLGSGGNYDQNSSLEFRIYGMTSPGDQTPNLLQTFTTSGTQRHETSSGVHGQNTTPWTNSGGYRLFRIGIWANAAIAALADDRYARISEFRVSTRGRALNISGTTSVSELIKDLWAEAIGSVDLHPLALGESGSNGIEVTGNVTGNRSADTLAFVDWTPPQDIVTAMVDIDGSRCGMWEPTRNPRAGAIDIATSVALTDNVWYRRPAELSYGPWSDVSDHDYVVRLNKGATWTPTSDPNELATMVYASYTNNAGKSVTDVEEDATTENRLWEQGKHRSVDWSITPTTALSTAQTLADQYLSLKRQPALIGTLTLYGDRPGSIEFPGGARVTSLATFKCGVIRVVDSPGAKTGRVESAVYTAKAPGQRETLVLTLNDPHIAKLDRRLNRMSAREARRRHQ